jgi:NAD(P) transhydrogenase subunit alpha
VAHHASALYARNLAALLEHLLSGSPKDGPLTLDLEDPIVSGCLFSHAEGAAAAAPAGATPERQPVGGAA